MIKFNFRSFELLKLFQNYFQNLRKLHFQPFLLHFRHVFYVALILVTPFPILFRPVLFEFRPQFCFWWRKIMNLCILGTKTRRSSRMSPPLECSNVPGKGWFEYVIGWSTYVYHVHALLSINLSLISESHLDIWKRRMFKTRLSRAKLKRLNRKIAKMIKTHLSVNIQCRYNSEIQKIWLNPQKFSKDSTIS